MTTVGGLKTGRLERGGIRGGGLTQRSGGGFLPFVSGAVVLIDAQNLDGTNNSTLSDTNEVTGAKCVNLGSLGGTFDGAIGKRPLFVASGINGNPVVRFLRTNVDELASSVAASNYQFLHDGSDFTIYMVLKPDSTTGTIVLLNTTVGAGSGTGIHLRQIATSKMSGYVFNEAVGEVHAINGATDTIDDDDYNLLIYQSSSTVWTFWNGVGNSVGTDAENNTPDAATDPDSTLYLSGETGSGATQFNGDFVHLSIYAGVHDSDTQTKQAAAINERFGTSL